MGRGESQTRLAPTRNPERPEDLNSSYKMHDSSNLALTNAQNILRWLLEVQPSLELDFQAHFDKNQLAARI